MAAAVTSENQWILDVTASEGVITSFEEAPPTSLARGVRTVSPFQTYLHWYDSIKWFQRRKVDYSQVFQVLPLESKMYFLFMFGILHYEVMC